MKRTLIVCGIVGLVVLLVPIPSSEAPLWTVCVVDEVNKPAAGVKVRESYRNYSAEFNDGERDLTTDGKGCVVFPAKRLWAPLTQRGAAMISSAGTGVHASFGPHVSVFAFSGGREGYATKNGFIEDWTGSPAVTQSRIVLIPTDQSDGKGQSQ